MKKVGLILGGILIVVLLASSASCPGPSTTSYSVEYQVTGSASTVFVTYENENGGTSQIASAIVPWSHTFTANSGDFVYISAQNNGDSGSVTVTILEDGNVFKTSTSSGAYVIADASGMLP